MRYQMYGIGNALVDFEFEVNDSFLKKHNIKKESMTIIGEEQYLSLRDDLNKNFKLKRGTCGGSAANTLCAFSQFGGNAFYACRVADDKEGQFYLEVLADDGVDTKLGQIKKDNKTGKCLVMLTEDSERTMNTFLGTTEFSESDLYLEELKNSEYLYIEGYLISSEISRKAVIKAIKIAKENNIKTVINFSNPIVVADNKEDINKVIAEGIDILFCNEKEAQAYAGEKLIHNALIKLSKVANKVVIKADCKGSAEVHNFFGNSYEDYKVYTNYINLNHKNGTNDIFAGAFMYGLCNGMSDQQALDLAKEAINKINTVINTRLNRKIAQEILKESYFPHLRPHSDTVESNYGNLELYCLSQTPRLKKLNVSNNNKLELLNCSTNNISALDLSKNHNLKYLNISRNPINHNTIKYPEQNNIETLAINFTKIEEIDLSKFKKLKKLSVGSLSTLDISKCLNLTSLSLNKTKLKSLDISNSHSLSHFSINEGEIKNLTCNELQVYIIPSIAERLKLKPTVEQKQIIKSFKLHSKALSYNWDDGLNKLKKILKDKNCNRATALAIFWHGNPNYYLQFKKISDAPEYSRQTYRFLNRLEKKLLNNQFPTGSISFNPKNHADTDWTIKYLDQINTLRQIDDILKKEIIGEKN